MIIMLSKYNAPFCEKPIDGVHFISLDDQRLMALGLYTSHVELYREISVSTFEAYDAIHNVTYVFESSKVPFSQSSSHPPVEAFIGIPDREFLDDLFLNSGIKAAGKRANRCF